MAHTLEDPRPGTAPSPGTPPEEAVPALVDAYGDRVYRLGMRICSDPGEAEDLVQETMVAALRSWPRFRGESHPYTWLFRIAMRTCRRMHRKRAGEPEAFLPLDDLLGIGEASSLRTSYVVAAAASSPDRRQSALFARGPSSP